MIDLPDLINALFEIGAAAVSWKNVRQLIRDRAVVGVWWPAWLMFSAWGWWNVYYYGPRLDQWASWWAGLFLVAANTTWVVLAVKYRNN